MALARVRRELGVELDADEPRMVGKLDDLAEVFLGRTRRHDEAGRFELIDVAVVDLVAVAVTLIDLRAIDRRGQRSGLDRAAGSRPRRRERRSK